MPNVYLPGVIQIPSALLITNITQSSPMVVSFTVPSTGSDSYIIGQAVRLTVPITWGMFQANGLIGVILSIDTVAMTMSLNIDSTLFDTFLYSPNSADTPASLAPAGSRNLQFNNQTDQLPFQSLNNIGN
jgi:hypothetical protein